jgi:hypothetical protein
MPQDVEKPRIANATTEPGKQEEEVIVTGEMINAGLRELAIVGDAFASASELTGSDLRAVYIAMRLLEPGTCSLNRP